VVRGVNVVDSLERFVPVDRLGRLGVVDWFDRVFFVGFLDRLGGFGALRALRRFTSFGLVLPFGQSRPRRPSLGGEQVGPTAETSLMASINRTELAKRLRDACSLTGHFVLRSGQVSDFYFDKYMLEADPELLNAVAEQFAPLVPDGTEMLAGLELGGVPLSTALSLLTGLPQVLVRKEAKTYGTAKLAEGPEIAGRRVLVVEDVITTGGQVVLSTPELRARGALVDTVLCVIDRRTGGDNGGDKLAEAAISMRPLFTLDDILGR
jgi:orotate phosphoribosyltransferase